MIRAAIEADLDRYCALLHDLVPDALDAASPIAGPIWRALLATSGVTVFVADVDGVLAASCVLIVTPNLTRGGRPYAIIENVVTRADLRRQGHGRAVMRAAMQAAWDAGCYKVQLLTGSTDPATHAFYRECGLVTGDKTAYVSKAAGF